MAVGSQPVLVTTPGALAAAVRELKAAGRIALDVESNGLFKYRASVCIVQVATPEKVFVVDALATPLAPLAGVLADPAVEKIIHDISFDARILAEEKVYLTNVRDTSIAARMLGIMSTGLATLLASELGVTLDKKMQHHDWSERPLDAKAIAYLSGDVVHLFALADRLFARAVEKGVADAVEEETRHRLAQARASTDAGDPRPPWVRLKGIDRTPKDELPILRRIAQLREDKARALDVPPHKVLGPDVLFAIAKAKPKTMAELEKIRGATQGSRARALAAEMLRAVADAKDGDIPDAERAMIERPRLPAHIARARRAREARLTKWRKAEAQKRAVDEQVILPGHCLQDLAELEAPSLEAIAQIAGIGAFRVERDGAALLALLASQDEETA